MQHANRGKRQQQRGHEDRGEDNNIYYWSVQSVRYGFQVKFLVTIFEKKNWAWISRSVPSMHFVHTVHIVHTVAQKSRKKNQSLIFAARHANRDKNLSFGLI